MSIYILVYIDTDYSLLYVDLYILYTYGCTTSRIFYHRFLYVKAKAYSCTVVCRYCTLRDRVCSTSSADASRTMVLYGLSRLWITL